MNKKILNGIIYSIFGILIIVVLVLLYLKSKEPTDENKLYQVNFNQTILKWEKYDYALGQKMLVGVEKSLDNGKTFTKVTKEPLAVSFEAQFSFLNENLGFVLATKSLSKTNDYLGFYVTQDGGKTFQNSIINYQNENIEYLNVEMLPYQINAKLKMEASIYLNKNETETLKFVSEDNGLTWNLES